MTTAAADATRILKRPRNLMLDELRRRDTNMDTVYRSKRTLESVA